MLHLWPVHGEEKVGVSLLDTVHGIQRTIQDRRFYPRNTTEYHQDSLHGALRLPSLPAPRGLIRNSDPRMWLHSNSVAGLF